MMFSISVMLQKKSLESLIQLGAYQKSAGQCTKKTKSKFYIDGTSVARKNQISELLHMKK